MTTEIDGPRSLRTGEMPALRELEAKVFRPSMPDEYPHVFSESNYENLTVCFDGARCVSHVGMVVRGASILGCRIDVGLIGGVATDPEYRGRGLAGACVDHAFARARRMGLDLLLVSGDRPLYRRRDCVVVGRDCRFTVTPADAAKAAHTLPRVRVEPLRAEDLSLIRDAYRKEPVRFLRHRDDYADLHRCGIVFDRLSDFLGVFDETGTFRAYVLAPRRAGGDGVLRVAEVGGDRLAVVAALPALAARYDNASLRLHVARHDTLLHALLTQAGVEATAPAPTEGTVCIVNFLQLMERLRPLLVETLGHNEAERLSFAEEEGTCIFRFEGDTLRVGRADAARLLFGSPETSDAQRLVPQSGLAGVLEAVLPLPALWYGLSYV